MTRRSFRRSTVAVRQGVIALALGLPLLGQSVQAQEQAPEVEVVEETITEMDTVEVEQPQVLISEVLIEGIAGHPEEERLQIAAYDAMQVRPGSRVTRD